MTEAVKRIEQAKCEHRMTESQMNEVEKRLKQAKREPRMVAIQKLTVLVNVGPQMTEAQMIEL